MNGYTGKDLARNFRVVRKNTLQMAQEIPEDKYGFRASPDTRTVGETLAHIAAMSGWQHQLHGVDKTSQVTFEHFGAHMQKAGAHEASLKSKAQIVKALETEGDSFAAWLDTLPDETLAQIVSFPPPIHPSQKTRFEMLLGVKEHEMHHRAQLMVIQRMIGIVPHLTRERNERMAATAAGPRA